MTLVAGVVAALVKDTTPGDGVAQPTQSGTFSPIPTDTQTLPTDEPTEVQTTDEPNEQPTDEPTQQPTRDPNVPDMPRTGAGAAGVAGIALLAVGGALVGARRRILVD